MGAGALLAFRAIAVIAHVGFVADVSPSVVFKGNAFAARDFGRCQAVEVVVVEALVQRLVPAVVVTVQQRSEEHTSELQSRGHLVCRLLLEKKKTHYKHTRPTEKYQST